MTEVVSFLKPDGYGTCGCGCGMEGRLKKPHRSNDVRCVVGCSCRPCLGSRSKRGGGAKQRKGAKALGIPTSSLRVGHEELSPGAVRWECKSGQQVSAMCTRYFAAEAQSEAARAIGDHRPFIFVAMPPGTSDGLAVIRLSNLPEAVAALAEQLGMTP